MLESGQLAIAVTTLELKHIISGNGFKLGFNVTGSCHVSQESVEAKGKLNRGMTNQIQRWQVVSTESVVVASGEKAHEVPWDEPWQLHWMDWIGKPGR